MRGYIAPSGPFCIPPSMVTILANEEEAQTLVFEKASFKIYPNPTTGRFTVELNKEPRTSPVVVAIFNMMGLRIFEMEIRSGRFHEFSLGDKVPGIYVISVVQDNETSIGKVIRQ